MQNHDLPTPTVWPPTPPVTPVTAAVMPPTLEAALQSTLNFDPSEFY